MKNKFAAVAFIFGLVLGCSAWGQSATNSDSIDEASKTSKLLAGVWRLTRYVDTPDGAQPVYAFGERPIGQFIFTENGFFSINIMHNPPAPVSAAVDIDPDACVPGWYCSYFGTFRLSANGKQWIAHVVGGNIPAYVGTNQTRTFQLFGDRLVISETYEEGGRTVRSERVLERAR